MKFILIAVIVIASAGLGNTLVAGITERQKMLISFVNGAKCIKNAMIYEYQPLYAALQHCGGNAFFKRCAEIMREHPEINGETLCKKALEGMSDLPLKNNEKELLSEFLQELSVSLVTEHISEATSTFLREYGTCLREVNQSQKKRVKLIKSICVLSGLTLGIILI